MFHRLRNSRILSAIYVGALTLFLFSTTVWTFLQSSLSFQDNLLGSSTEAVATNTSLFLVPGVSLIAVFAVALNIIRNALKHRQFGTLIFALACLGLSIAGVFLALPYVSGAGSPLMEQIFLWLLIEGVAWCVGASLFVTGVKGLQAIQQRRWWSVGFALAIDLLLPACLMSFYLWGNAPTSGGSLQLAQGSFLIGNVVFPSITVFILVLLFKIGPYLLLGTLLLALASDESMKRNWPVTRGFGLVFVFVLVFNLAVIVIWDVNRWLGGKVQIGDPAHGVWPLFGGQWTGPLMTNALLLAVLLGFVLLALIRSFSIQPEDEQSVVQAAS